MFECSKNSKCERATASGQPQVSHTINAFIPSYSCLNSAEITQKLATGVAAMSMLLPFELVVEIMSWLPIKSLLRFKCVNKTWHSVILSPQFAKLHLSRSTDHHRLLLTTWPPQSVDYEAFQARKVHYPEILARDGDNEDPYPAFLGSCDGLLCLHKENHMFLWNPTTGNSSHIPSPNVAFNHVFLHGVGYNRCTKDYGVICASRFDVNGAKETVIELYTLKTGTWKRIEQCGSVPESILSGSGISWNGDVYWLLSKGRGYAVICFDMVEEKFKEVLQLPNTDKRICDAHLGMCENGLCAFIRSYYAGFEVLILKKAGSKVSYENRVFEYPVEVTKAICLTKSGKIVMDYKGWEIYLYDPELRRGNGSFFCNHKIKWELYRESLVSPVV